MHECAVIAYPLEKYKAQAVADTPFMKVDPDKNLARTSPDAELGHYKPECYRQGQTEAEHFRYVNARTLSLEIDYLIPNTLHECAVIAYPRKKSKELTGAWTASKRSSSSRTWPESEYFCLLSINWHSVKTRIRCVLSKKPHHILNCHVFG
ncbi:unnamed protein product [Schistocephalus solidus]|uniref:DNA-directed DNA polymerase n=1 Tax=Schistocephalus solidus TaxID=70667 RepID=A0A183TI07_SCHSO|nr:unnamed protein product [Schistocephalus solidus]